MKNDVSAILSSMSTLKITVNNLLTDLNTYLMLTKYKNVKNVVKE